jgi:hypothetical protein
MSSVRKAGSLGRAVIGAFCVVVLLAGVGMSIALISLPSPGLWIAVFPLFFALAGGAGAYVAFFGRGTARVRPMSSAKGAGLSYTSAPSRSEPATLKPKVTRTRQAVTTIALALFCCAYVVLFLVKITDIRSRGASGVWFLSLFGVFWAGMGILLVAGAMFQLLQLLNPRATIKVSSPVVPIGDELTVDWSIDRAGKLRRFKIDLEGREEATYPSGRSKYTERQVFATLPVMNQVAPALSPAGSAKIVIPATMHSFDARNNKVVWVLRVRGDIRHWPDSDDAFPLTLAPRQ